MWEWPGDEAKFTLGTKIEQPAEVHVRHFCMGWLAKYYPRTQAIWEEGKVAWYPLFAHAWTSLIMDKLHMVYMRRNNQTRFMAFSVAAGLRGDSFHYQRHKGWHDKDYATTTASSTVTVLVVETNGSLVADGLPKSHG